MTLHRLKAWIRWGILGGCLFFLAKVFREHWQNVWEIQLLPPAWACLAIGLGVTLLAHITAGWAWGMTLRDLQQPVPIGWLIRIYLRTNVAKYLPGNIWHYYGRIKATTQAGVALGTGTVSVLLEPLLMVASAFAITLLCSAQVLAHYGWLGLLGQWLGLPIVLVAIHPLFLNPVIRYLNRKKSSPEELSDIPMTLQHYPWRPLVSAMAFVMLRGLGFVGVFWAVTPITAAEWPLVISVFSLAWLLGMIIPGAPGGAGVFEVIAIALLSSRFAPAQLLSAVALYRLISILAEAAGAGLAWLDERRLHLAG